MAYGDAGRSHERPPESAAFSSGEPPAHHPQPYHRPPSEPSKHVIFLGIDPDMEEADVRDPDRFD
jgi:hypothetical protein